MNCSKCGKELKPGDYALEVASGCLDYSGDAVYSENLEAVLCEKCEEEVMPAFWADMNDE